MNQKKDAQILKKSRKAKQSSLPEVESFQEFVLKKKVQSWSNDEANSILKSVVKVKENTYQLVVGIQLDGEMVQQFTNYSAEEDIESTISEMMYRMEILMKNLHPYDSHFQ